MSFLNSWGSSTTSPGVRAGAVTAVLAAHIGVGAALFYASPEKKPIEEPSTVQVRFVEIAPEVQEVQAPMEVAEPIPEPAAAEPPTEELPPPEPEPQPEPPPEPEPEPPPPEPEPPPPPPPEPPPKPKPEPKPAPKPKPKPEPKPAPRPKPPAEPPKAVRAPVSSIDLPPAGRPAASAQRNVAPAAPKAPVSNTPKLIGSVDYVGRRPSPDYPRASQRMREEGRVIIRVTIDVNGRVQRAAVQRSSGFSRLDQAALKAAQRARFRPYTENGVPYPAMADIPFDFQLR